MMQSLQSLPPVYILGGFQTDFGRHITREGKGLIDLLREASTGALADAQLGASDIQVAHVANFVGELANQQGHLGSLLVEAEPGFSGLPTSRHEAACASGSVATLAAMADLQSNRYDVALVTGVEIMRNKNAVEAQALLGCAALVPDETTGVTYHWPKLLSDVGDEYARRYGLDPLHLRAIARNNFACARKNPRAQGRGWKLDERCFSDDDQHNPVIHGRLRRYDCCPVTDGAVALVLATAPFAAPFARKRGVPLDALPRISGFGHRTSRMRLSGKLDDSRNEPYMFPHVRGTITDAFARAGVHSVDDLDAIECHDCFTIMEYMIVDHFGFGPPGWPMQAIEEGRVLWGGRTPINPSGGLLGGGHPVGATGIRMLLDAVRQVRGQAGEMQVAHARRVATLNIGGSASTSVCFIVEGRGK
jgi:acetyl-CoA C-acetyltransferase